MIFGTYKLHNARNEMMLSFCHYVNFYSPEGATNTSTFYLHLAVLLSLNFFYIETVHSFLHSLSLLKFYSKQKFVWFCYLVVFIGTLLFCKQLPVLPGFVVKNNAVQYRSLRWENLTRL